MIPLLIIIISILTMFDFFPKEDNNLYVVVPLFNPSGYDRRWQLHKEFIERYSNIPGVKLVTVEAFYEGWAPKMEKSKNHAHIPVIINEDSTFWIKENLVNIGIKSLPVNWKYVSWIDGDIMFLRPDWAEETKRLLNNYDVIQMFSSAVDITHRNMPYQVNYGYIYEKIRGWQHSENPRKDAYGHYFCSDPINFVHNHSGYAWAMNRYAYETLGGLMDRLITGAADRAMAYCLFEEANQNSVLIKDSDRAYKEYILNYQKKAKGLKAYYMDGSIIHYFHGAKKFRGYMTRPKILTDHKFNPYKDLKMQPNGVYKLVGQDNMKIDLRNYFNSRNENSTEL